MSRLISRAEWGARAARSTSSSIHPEGVTVHYGGPSPWGSGGRDHGRCASIVRAWQAYHMDNNGWADIAYTSMVCPHGVRFEGRGPGRRTAAQGTNAGNDRSYAVCYIAGGSDPLTDAAKAAFLAEGARLKPLAWGHQDWKSTACPGTDLWAWRQAGFPGQASTPTTPDSGDDDMQADEREWLKYMHDMLKYSIGEGQTTPAGTVVSAHKHGVETLRRIREVPDGGQFWLRAVSAARFVRDEADGTGTEQEWDEIASFVADAVQADVATALLELTPEAIAEAIPDELAGQVADELAARLSA